MGALYFDQSISRREDPGWLGGLTLTAYPNPSVPRTTVAFTLTHAQWVSIDVFDPMGVRCNTLTRGFRAAGRHQIVWDGRGSEDQPLANGVYFVRLTAGLEKATRRIMLLH